MPGKLEMVNGHRFPLDADHFPGITAFRSRIQRYSKVFTEPEYFVHI